MITENNTQTPEANIETLLAVGCLDHLAKDTEISKTIVYADLSPADKAIYDAYFNLSNKAYVTIENVDCTIGIDRITSSTIIIETETLDYATMSVQDKAIVDAFIDLLVRAEIVTPSVNN